MIRVGTVLYGFCSGNFGRDSYEDKRVEAISADWVVAREISTGLVVFCDCAPEELEKYLHKVKD